MFQMVTKAVHVRWHRLTIDWLVHHLLHLIGLLCDYRALMRCFRRTEDEAELDDWYTDYGRQMMERILSHASTHKPTFMVRPTVILRVVVPSSGYSVLVRALIDTGASNSNINNNLAKTLLTKVCASTAVGKGKSYK